MKHPATAAGCATSRWVQSPGGHAEGPELFATARQQSGFAVGSRPRGWVLCPFAVQSCWPGARANRGRPVAPQATRAPRSQSGGAPHHVSCPRRSGRPGCPVGRGVCASSWGRAGSGEAAHAMAQLIQPSPNPGLDGAQRQAELLCQFAVAQVTQVGQTHHLTLFVV